MAHGIIFQVHAVYLKKIGFDRLEQIKINLECTNLGVNLAYGSQPFSTIGGKDVITKIKFHPELVDGNVSTCLELNDWTEQRWFMWADFIMSRNGDIRLKFDQAGISLIHTVCNFESS